MHPSRILRQHTARLTLFTKANCSLCDTAKGRIDQLRTRRNVEYSEIDVMAPGQKRWKDVYEFDTPVLHVERIMDTSTKPDIVSEAKKLMHRFSEAEIDKLLDEAEGHS